MAAISWKYNTNGLWSNAANWSGGVLPGAADDVTLGTTSSHTITFSSITATIHSLTATTDSLALTSGTLGVLTTANFGQNLSVTGGTFALLGTTATVSGIFTGANAEIQLATGAQLNATDTVFGLTNYGNNGPEIDGGTLSTGGTVNVLSGYNDALLLGGGVVWNNTAAVTDNGAIYAGDGFGLTATINNLAGANFDLSTGGGVYTGTARGAQGQTNYGTSTFSNAGTVALTSGTGTAHIVSVFSNTGLISATTGVLEFDGGGTFGGTLSGAGTVAFGGGTVALSTGANTGVANLLIDGGVVTPSTPLAYAGSLTLSGGTLALAAGSNSFGGFSDFSGSSSLRLGTASSLALTNAYLGAGTIDGGTLSTAGTTTLAGYGGNFFYMGGGTAWTNSGTITQNYYFAVDTSSGAAFTVTNQAGGVWNIAGDGYWIGGYSTASGPELAIFNNAGTYEKTGGTSTTNCYAQFNSTGTINAATGTLEFDNGGTIGGTLTGAGTVAFGGGNFSFASNLSAQVATIYLDGGSVTLGSNLNPSGNLVFGSGYLNLNGDSLSLAGAALYNGTVDGPGTLALSGSTQLGNNSFYFGGNASISNTGTILQNGSVYISYQSGAGFTLNNAAGAVYDILGNDQIGYYNYNGTSSSLVNAGLFAKAGGTGTANIASALTNTGIITSNSGILEFDGGGSVGGTLSGAGTIAFGGGNFAFGSAIAVQVATIYVDGGSVTLGGNLSESGSLVFGSGYIYLNGDTLAATSANLYNGTIDGAGTLSLSGTTQLGTNNFYFGGGVAISNTGTILDNNTVYISTLGGAFTLNNAAGADFQFTTSTSIGYNNGTGLTATINNAGIFASTGGSNASTVYSAFNNTGTITGNAAGLDFVGGGTFSGSLTGTSYIDFGGGNETFAAGLTSSVATLYVAGADVTLGANFSTGSSQFTLTSQINLAGFTLATANANLGDSTFIGAGTVTISGTTQIAGYQGNGYYDYFGGGMVLTNTGTVNDDYYTQVVNQSSINAFTINNQSGAVWNLNGDFQIGGNQAGGETSTFNNAGLFAKTGGTSYDSIYSYFTNTGTVSSNFGTTGIVFYGGGTFGGSITGTSFVDFQTNAYIWAGLTGSAATSSNQYQASIDVTASSTLGNLSFQSTSVTLAAGATLTVTGTLAVTANGQGLPLDGAGSLVTSNYVTISDWYNNGVMVSVGGGSTWQNSGTVASGGILQIGDNQTQYGSVAGTVINTAAGVYELTTDDAAIFEGSYVNSFGQTLSSGGIFINAGMFEKTGGTSTSHVYASFTSTGTVATTSGTLGFYAGGSFGGVIADGSNVGFDSGTFTQNALTVGGGATLTSNATVTSLGNLTIGDASTLAATFDNTSVFDIGANVGILTSATAGSSFVNTGTLAKTGGTGRSAIAVGLANSGTVIVQSGTLALTGGVSGTGVLEIGAGTTLELGAGVASTQGVTFTAPTGTLLLDTPTAYAGTVSGLTVGDSFDLAGVTATTATVNGSDQLVISNGTTVVTKINLTGSYTSDSFTLTSDGHGGELVTLSAAKTAWKGTTGDWYAANVWSNAPPNLQTNASVSLSGSYTLSLASNETAFANTLSLSAPSAIYALNGVLDLATSLTLTAGDLQLGGTINGGTLIDKGGTFTFGGNATLNNVVYDGPLDLSENYAQLVFAGSFAINAATGSGATSIALTGYQAYLSFAGYETLGNAVLSIGNASGTDYLQAYDPGGTGAILTLASSLTVTQTGLHAVIDDSGNAFDAVYNDGKIIAALSGGTFTTLGDDFENDGTISVSNGDTFNIASAQFVNTKTLTVNGATLGLTASYQNTGSVTATNSVLNIGGTLTGAQLNAIALGGDTLNLTGTLALGGATLSVGPTAKIVAANLGGNINGGTVNATGTGFTFLNGASLANVTYNGTMTVGSGVAVSLSGTIANAVIADSGSGILFAPQTVLQNTAYRGALTLLAGDEVGILGGITLSGAGGTGQGAIVSYVGSAGDTLSTLDSETLSNVAITSGEGSGGTLGLELDAAGAKNTTLSLGSTTTLTVLSDTVAGIESIGLSSGLALGNTVSSAGVIVLQLGAELNVDASVGSFTNAGSISIAGGGVATIGSAFAETGTVAVAAGASFDVDGATTLAALAGVGGAGTLGINGLLALSGGNFDMAASGRIANVQIGGTLQGGTFTNDAGTVTFGTLATLSGMVWQGLLAIGAGSTVDVVNGLTVETVGGGVPSAIALNGGASAGGSLIYAGSATLNNVSVSASGSAGLASPSLQDALGLGAAGTLTFGSASTLAVSSGALTLLDTGGVGAIVNNGAIDVNGGQLWVDGSIGSFANASVMNFAADTALEPSTTGTGTTNFSNTGTVNLVSLDNFDWSGNGSNAGLLAIGTGSEASFGGNFANTGSITMAHGGSLTVNGTMTNSGKILASGATTDFVSATGGAGSAFYNGTLTGGTWSVSGNSTLTLNANMAITTDAASIVLAGSGSVLRSVGSSILRLESTLKTISAGGSLSLQSSRGYVTSLALTDAGTVQLGGGTLTAAGLTIAAGGKLFGSGIITNAITDSGVLQASGGTLALQGSVTGTGQVQIAASAELSLGSATAATVTYLGSSAELALVSPTSFTGTLSGFAATDSLLLESTSATKAVLSGGTLTVSLSSGTETFNVAGNSSTVTLTVTTSGGNSLLTYPGAKSTAMRFMAAASQAAAPASVASEAAASLHDVASAPAVAACGVGGPLTEAARLDFVGALAQHGDLPVSGALHGAFLFVGRE